MRSKTISALTISFMAFSLFLGPPALASSIDDACAEAKANNKSLPAFCKDYNTGENEGDDPDSTPLKNVLNGVINILLYAAGALAVIFIVFGGFKYLKSGGDSNKVADAKNTIIYSLVGLVVALLANRLIVFFINRLL